MSALAAMLLASAPCVGPVCNFDTLRPVLSAMFRAEGGQTMHILQIGDSHTAGDVLTGAWRPLLQKDPGTGGRGVLPPGLPYAGYRARGVHVTMSAGWQIAATFGPGSAPPRPLLGISGFTLTAVNPGASMAMKLDPSFERFVLCGIAGPGAGTVTARIDEADAVIDFAADAVMPRCREIPSRFSMQEVTLTTGRGPVVLTSWGTFAAVGGVSLSNLGVVGSQLTHFARTDDAVVAEEMRAYAPDLIVLAFGTNEGFAAPRIDVDAYEALLTRQITRLRALSGDVPILLLGPPDALSRNPALRGEANDCPGAPGWFAPPGLTQVRQVQRRVADALHVAFWDWQAKMGGRCSAVRWVAEGKMAADHVHFRDAGGPQLAEMLQDDLITQSAER